MTAPKHYVTSDDLLHSDDLVITDGTTYTNHYGQIRRWNDKIRDWENTDTPAGLDQP